MDKGTYLAFEATKLTRLYGPSPADRRRAVVMMQRRGIGFLKAKRAVATVSGAIANQRRVESEWEKNANG